MICDEEMRETAVKRGSKTLELASLISQSNLHGHYTGVFNPLKSKELAQAALVLARELGDREAEAGVLWGLQVAELLFIPGNIFPRIKGAILYRLGILLQ